MEITNLKYTYILIFSIYTIGTSQVPAAAAPAAPEALGCRSIL